MARLLYRGCEPGMDVMELQDCLNSARQAVGEGSAFDTLAVDGAFGALTQSRVLEFQRDHRLGADGIVGSRTWGMLEAVLLTIPGLEVRRPLGGGGNAGTGPGAQGGVAYGKPGTGGPDVAGAAAGALDAVGAAAGAAWNAAAAGASAWSSGGSKSAKGGTGPGPPFNPVQPGGGGGGKSSPGYGAKGGGKMA